MSDSIGSDRYPFKAGRYGSHSRILNVLGNGAGRSVLDIGCGAGHVSALLKKQGWEVTGVELDSNLARMARNRGIEVFECSAEETPNVIDRSFDAVVLGDVIEHTVDPLLTLRSASLMLNSGGLMVVSVPNVAHALVRLSIAAGRFEYADRGILDRTHLRFFTLRSFQSLLKEASLEVSNITSTAPPIEEILPQTAEGKALFWVQGANALLSRAMPRLFGYQFVAVLKAP